MSEAWERSLEHNLQRMLDIAAMFKAWADAHPEEIEEFTANCYEMDLTNPMAVRKQTYSYERRCRG